MKNSLLGEEKKVEVPQPRKPVLYIPKLWTPKLNLNENTNSEKHSSKPRKRRYKSGRKKRKMQKHGSKQ